MTENSPIKNKAIIMLQWLNWHMNKKACQCNMGESPKANQNTHENLNITVTYGLSGISQ